MGCSSCGGRRRVAPYTRPTLPASSLKIKTLIPNSGQSQQTSETQAPKPEVRTTRLPKTKVKRTGVYRDRTRRNYRDMNKVLEEQKE